ncbi:MAG: gliding motility-associated C-terminal domain-containing protein [Saprospiraceae bacterium]|nr:gliding motility-associated C-terminal domain-containing protein [Saprospiraceae bacterium]
MKIFRLLLFFITFHTCAYAQIPAPILKCVKRDTLLWDTPIVACGTVTNYQIWAARNLTGPYSVLATVTNPNQTRYFHNNIEGGTWYYYMTTTANCAGQNPRFSDTLDNEAPALNPVLVVSVVDNRTVDIRWRRSPSSKVVGYIVYKQTASGLIPLTPTVSSRDSIHYLDRTANPAAKVESYQVLAVDACGSTSLFDQSHNTIRLQAKQSKCDQTISLNWNLYKNWANPIVRHDIWVGVNGRSPYLFGSVGAKDTTFIIRNVPDRDRYNIVVRAVQSVTNINSQSNDTTVIADIIQPVKTLIMKNATVNDKGQVEIVWRWNLNAKVDSVRILRGTSDSSYQEIRRFKPTYPLDDEAFFVDSSARTSDFTYYYKVETKDDCGAKRVSNHAKTLLLKVNSLAISRQNRLIWDTYSFPLGTVLGYQPNRIVNNAVTPIGLPLDVTSLEFLDGVSIDEPRVCYNVGANYKYTLPDGSSEEATSLSNTVCLDQFAKMWLPNAFTPDGKNPEFRPLLTFTNNIAAYSMQIYDRWGNRLFQTSDTAQGWDGKHNGTNMPQAAYTYYIRLVQSNKEIIEKTGVVMLIR